jgi:taurine transport system substrate-binding protein
MRLSIPLITLTAGVLVASALTFLVGCKSKAAAKPAEIRIGFQVSPNGELLAKALGLAEQKFPGIKVSWKQFDSGRDVNTAIAAGGIDFGLVGTPPGAAGVARGLPYQVYYFHDIIGTSEALVVKTKANIKSIQDLKGKKIATTFGSTSHFSLLSALRLSGVNPADVTLLDLQQPDLIAAWQRGDIDGGYVWQPTQAKLVNAGGVVITDSGKLADQGAVTGEFGVVRTAFATQYPQIVADYISVLDEAVRKYRSDPQASAQALSKELGLSPADSLKAMTEIIVLDASQQADPKYLGTPGKPGAFAQLLKDTADFLVVQKSLQSAPALAIFQQAIYNAPYAPKK